MTTPHIPAQRSAEVLTEDWRTHAACRHADPRLFFPAGPDALVWAKRVCAGCPVRSACLDWALGSGGRIGVWGGTTEGERRTMGARRSPSSVQRAPRQH